MNKTYIASVRNKITKKIEIITKEYHTKKEFAEDLRFNGYRIRFITTPEKFDDDCDKYHRSCERSKAIQKHMRQYKVAERKLT